jgi:two-component system, OmpR family, response regulator
MMPDLRFSATDQPTGHSGQPTANYSVGERTISTSGHGAGFAESGGTALRTGHLHSVPTRRIKILIIDDDMSMRILLRGCFEHAGFSVVEAENADQLWVAMAQHQFDLVTLDVRLPGAGGLELVQAIRQRSDVPVVMISVISNLIDRVAALERGADDFIVKPFDLMDLLARVRAVVRRSEARSGGLPTPVVRRRYAFDGWLFDAGRRELTSVKGDIKSLTDQELSLLELFVLHPQRELSRETIINHLHGTSNSDSVSDLPGTDNGSSDGDPQSSRLRVDMQVSRLRKKLELPDNPVSVIKSVRGVGYVFATTVEATIG